MIKQLIINGLRSYDDFGLMIAARKISQPKKKIVKESIPFSNVVYDFSNLNGEIYWEERTLEYSFDIAEFTTEEMEEIKSDVLNWLLNVHDVDIYDPYIYGYHFHGSFDSDSWDEDFGAGVLNISFTVYPYMIANDYDENIINVVKDEVVEDVITNKSSHRISPTIIVDGTITFSLNGTSYSISTGTYDDDDLFLLVGENKLIVNGEGTITFRFIKERF